MKKVLSIGLAALLSFSVHAQNAVKPAVVVMSDRLIALAEQSSGQPTPAWTEALKRYDFIAAYPLSEMRPAPGLERYTITQTFYGIANDDDDYDDMFPSFFVVYKDHAVVAFLGAENRPNQSVTHKGTYPIMYTALGQNLPLNEKKQLENWFYSWIDSVN